MVHYPGHSTTFPNGMRLEGTRPPGQGGRIRKVQEIREAMLRSLYVALLEFEKELEIDIEICPAFYFCLQTF